jgi:polysaccharide biosynthesis protein PslH
VLDEEIPFPPNSGKRVRTWNLLRRLASRHRVSLLCYGHADDSSVEALRKAGITTHIVQPKANATGWRLYLQLFLNLFSCLPFSVTKHYSSEFRKRLDALLAQQSWDFLQCEWTPYARFVARGCRIPVLISTHNVESQIWERRKRNASTLVARVFFWTQEVKMRRFERHALLDASRVTAVTADDVETLRSWGVKNLALIPNGVDLRSFAPAPEMERKDEILFLGSLDWHPNVDALLYFAKQTLPLLRARNPQVMLRIVGRKPAESLKRALSGVANIDFIGDVERVLPYLHRATVVVVPLRIGGGSRIKILEALAAGKAVVSTSIGAEGLDVTPGEHLFIADSPSDFAQCVNELLASKKLRDRIGEQGRKLVTDRYGWDGIAAELETVWFRTAAAQANAKPSYFVEQKAHAIP